MSRLLDHHSESEEIIARRVFAEVDKSVSKLKASAKNPINTTLNFKKNEQSGTSLSSALGQLGQEASLNQVNDTGLKQDDRSVDDEFKLNKRWSLYLFLATFLTTLAFLYWLSIEN